MADIKEQIKGAYEGAKAKATELASSENVDKVKAKATELANQAVGLAGQATEKISGKSGGANDAVGGAAEAATDMVETDDAAE